MITIYSKYSVSVVFKYYNISKILSFLGFTWIFYPHILNIYLFSLFNLNINSDDLTSVIAIYLYVFFKNSLFLILYRCWFAVVIVNVEEVHTVKRSGQNMNKYQTIYQLSR